MNARPRPRSSRRRPPSQADRGARSIAARWLLTSSGLAIAAACSTGQPADPSLDTSGDDGGAPDPNAANGPGAAASDAGSAGAAGGFDYPTFATTIQPILDTAEGKGCTAAACHGAPGGQNGFALVRTPALGSPEMRANFDAVTARCDPNVPDQSLFYKHATTRHAGGNSAVVSQAQASTLLAWIQHAAPPVAPPPTTVDGGDTDGGAPATAPGCVGVDKFNLGVFASEILPVLLGDIDYNAPPGQPTGFTGCARATCHGVDRGGKALFLSPSNTPAKNLASLGCYVKPENPSASAILACPLNSPGCPKQPHPGQNVFRDPTDRNYQRMLAFLYATAGAASPYDFAFFVRQIDPIFKDPRFGGLAGAQRTCANTSTCHGVNAAGQIPPNLSNFPILASATTKDQLLVDYVAAASFANFLTPQGSELFLFPTDLTSDVTQPFASGLHHPGGIDFGADSASAASSPEAQAILQWAGGLRPDGSGFVLPWLVAGTYSATQINQPTAAGDETKLAPTIFDPDAAPTNDGQWDAFVSPSQFVDLNVAFPGSPGSGRVAYAVAYAINTTAADLANVLLSVSSPNVVEMYVDGKPIAQSQGNGGGAIGGFATIPAFTPTKPSTRIVLKVLQRPGDAQFGFSLSMANQNGTALTNATGEIVLRLDPAGGI